MISKSTLALVAAIAAVGIASPALAQSFDPDMGTGNIVGGNSAPIAAPQHKATVRASGLRAYALVPHDVGNGTSSGYEELLKEQW